MNRTLALPLVALLFGASVWAFQDPAAPPPMPQVTAEHKTLHRSVGTWDATVDMAGQAEKGTMVVELGPGGFTTITRFEGTMMGSPFQGRGIDGYDTTKKKYVAVWTDSMAASPLLMEGTWDDKAQSLIMHGEMLGMSGKMEKAKFVTKYTGNDTMDFEIFGAGPDGKDASMVKIHYTRKK